MFQERLLSIAEKMPVEEMGMSAGFSDETKVGISIASASVNLLVVYFFSRTMDGFVNSKWEKRIVGAATIGTTAALAIINYQVWT